MTEELKTEQPKTVLGFRFLPDAKAIAKRAWSFKWAIASALLSAFEVAAPVLEEHLTMTGLVPRGVFAGLAAAAAGFGALSRLLAQREAGSEQPK